MRTADTHRAEIMQLRGDLGLDARECLLEARGRLLHLALAHLKNPSMFGLSPSLLVCPWPVR